LEPLRGKRKGGRPAAIARAAKARARGSWIVRQAAIRRSRSILLTGVSVCAAAGAYAADGTWTGPGAEWTTGTNWSSSPTVPGGTATFTNNGAPTSVTISNNASISTIQFNSGAPSYLFSISPPATLDIFAGIANNSINAPNFINNGGLNFHNSSTASNANITNNGNFNFFDNSTASNANITNNNNLNLFQNATLGNATVVNNGSLGFHFSSTAGNATIITNNGGSVFFMDTSTGGNARFITNAGGIWDMSSITVGGMTVGSIEGAGHYFLDAHALTVGTNNLSTTVSGVISDGGISGGTAGSIIKVGSGTLTLSGINTYTGTTTVNGGALLVDGSIASSSGVTVNSGAILAGTGTVGSAIINAGGTLSPGNPTGTLNVSGNLGFAAGSQYVVNISSGIAGRTDVTGSATLAGTVQVVALPGGILLNKYTILSAAGGVVGTFDSLTAASGALSASLNYVPNDVLLTLTSQLNRPGLTVNQASVATALDQSFNAGRGSFGGLFGLPINQIPAALNALSGEGSSGTQETAFAAGGMFVSMMMEQGAFWRSGETIDMNGVTLSVAAMQYANEKTQPAVFKAMPGQAPQTFEQRWRAWTAGFDETAQLGGEAGSGSAGLAHRAGGGAAGFDYVVNPNLLLGAAAGGSASSFSVADRATSGSLDGTHLGTYGVGRWGPWYAAGALAASFFENNTNRAIAGIGPTELASGRFDSEMFSGRFEVGVRQAYSGFAITPFAALQFAELWQPSYSEASTPTAGAPGVFGLTYASRAIPSLPTFLGAQAETRLVFANGTVWSPYARVSWVHEFDPTRNVAASFIALPGTGFTVDGPRAARDAARIDAGAKLAISRNASLFGSFSGEFSDRSQMYTGKGGFKFVW
jgi:autotransporter-associated beta strand protein